LWVITLSKTRDARTAAALALQQVIVQRTSLTSAIDEQSKHLLTSDISLFKAIVFGVMRHFETLSQALQPLLDKPLRNKDKDIYALLLIGAYQLKHMRTPDYAAIDSCVKAGKALKKPWAAGLINAVLRRFQLQGDIAESDQVKSEHPLWLYNAIVSAWPDNATDIFSANNTEPPLCIRVNSQQISRNDYLAKLISKGIPAEKGEYSPTAIYLPDKPANIVDLPGFADGECSVQDEAPQLSAFLLDLAPGQRVLDACAAPGGKTCHILETEPQLKELVAVDHDEKRLVRVKENLARLHLHATCIAADILDTDAWWDGQQFDRILCDAPCSATGVIRRHPDIKFLRMESDILKLRSLQLQILQSLWQALKPGGILLYATCSILPEENSKVVGRFCQQHSDCEEITIPLDCGIVQEHGRQLFPQPGAHDGFFYAKLKKRDVSLT
jgi:16S rRNA (cytosine967-C5)-methyltransferase